MGLKTRSMLSRPNFVKRSVWSCTSDTEQVALQAALYVHAYKLLCIGDVKHERRDLLGEPQLLHALVYNYSSMSQPQITTVNSAYKPSVP